MDRNWRSDPEQGQQEGRCCPGLLGHRRVCLRWLRPVYPKGLSPHHSLWKRGWGGGALSCPHLWGSPSIPQAIIGSQQHLADFRKPPVCPEQPSALTGPDELEGKTPGPGRVQAGLVLAWEFVDIIDREE